MDLTHVFVLSKDAALLQAVRALLPPAYTVSALASVVELEIILQRRDDIALLLVDLAQFTDPAALSHQLQGAPVVLVAAEDTSPALLGAAQLQLEVVTIFQLPLAETVTSQILEQTLRRFDTLHQRVKLEQALASANRQLNQRLQEINTVYTVGKSVASSLDLDQVLARVVETSVNLTQAEEGFILLYEGNRLYLRVSKNLHEDLIKRFNIEASDSIAWQVITSGRPAMLRRELQIATGYMVRALLYLPLRAPGRGVVGVLGVVNRQRDEPFTESQLFALSSLADFAAIALENARLFASIEAESLRLRAVLENAVDVIFVVDSNNRLLLWSDMAGQTFDVDESARGKLITDAVNNEALGDLFQLSEGDAPQFHAEITLEDGRTFNAQLSIIDSVGRVVVMQDITHLKELDRLKSEFVSTVSHDLRTPLTTVQGYIELLDRVGPLNQMQRSFIDKAMGSLAHITALISDLLDIGRIEAGYDLEMCPCRLEQLVLEAVEIFKPKAALDGIELQLLQVDSDLWVMGNSRRLRQVLNNLLSNALKYNSEDGWVKISAQRDDDHVIVRVADAGIGIPPEEQSRVFERFYRVVTDITQDIQGTGLGLAIVKSVVEKHKGRAWVESAEGEGSTFAFVLPLLDQEAWPKA